MLAGPRKVTLKCPALCDSGVVRAPQAGIEKVLRVPVVFVGPVGELWPGEKSAAEIIKANRAHPSWRRIAIDFKTFSSTIPCEQITADFETGLRALPDASVARIFSAFALGYYYKNGLQVFGDPVLESKHLRMIPVLKAYTATLLELCYDKLISGGVVHLIADQKVTSCLLDVANATRFGSGKITVVEARHRQQTTFWENQYSSLGYKPHRILLRKEGKRDLRSFIESV